MNRDRPAIYKNIVLQAPLVWLQLTYRKSRFLMASLGIASAIILMFVQLGFLGALYESTTVLHRHLRGDLVMLHEKTAALVIAQTFARRRLYHLLSVDSVANVIPIYQATGNFRNLNDGFVRTIAVFGINPQTQPFDFPGIDEQMGLIQLTDTVLFDRNSRPEYGIGEEDADTETVIEVNGERVKIAGLIDFTGTSFGVTGNLLTSDVNFQRLFIGQQPVEQITFGLIQLNPGLDAEVVATQLQSSLPADVKILTTEQFTALEQDYWKTTTAVGFVFQMGAAVGFFIGMYIVYQVLYTDIADHIPDYAILKAKGYQDSYFWGLVLQEGVILSISSYIPGYWCAIALYKLVKAGTKLPVSMTHDRAIIVLGLTLLMSLFAGFLVTRKLKDSDPADLF